MVGRRLVWHIHDIPFFYAPRHREKKQRVAFVCESIKKGQRTMTMTDSNEIAGAPPASPSTDSCLCWQVKAYGVDETVRRNGFGGYATLYNGLYKCHPERIKQYAPRSRKAGKRSNINMDEATKLLQEGHSLSGVAMRYGVHYVTLKDVCTGHRWKVQATAEVCGR